MIVLNLVCNVGHKFEGWFASVESFEAQVREDLVSCPHCHSRDVERLPAAPHLVRATPEAAGMEVEEEIGRFMDMLGRVADASEDVGRRFPEEARRIHYREAEVRSIRGQANFEETRELLEEGIPVLPVPRKPRTH